MRALVAFLIQVTWQICRSALVRDMPSANKSELKAVTSVKPLHRLSGGHETFSDGNDLRDI